MSVSSVSGTSTTTNSSATSNYTLGTDAFLQILVAQLKNQNPLNPAEPQDFVAELAQLSSVEQLTNISKAMDGLKEITGNSTAGTWVSSIGKSMNVLDVYLSEGDYVTFSPDDDFDQITLTLENQADETTKTVTLSSTDPLIYTVEDSESYKITGLTAKKGGGQVDVAVNVYRIIRGVQIADSGVQLVAGDGRMYPASDVKLITQ
ncbi:MAG: flagellar basal body rod modification protein [Syntrophorhabdaceae bacterium PtaU1.Bin034]|jgi:flagellar basal-body rod modification protein FlgD|nr:MAG: flagellar basal body rod modification protein [Syntrophorhabdaceae bacterium PtaU1.Bin034]